MALAGIFAAALFLGMTLRLTERLVQRERVRARADVAAFSAGVNYARGLNLLAASQKVVALGLVISVFDMGRFKKQVQKFQRYFYRSAPYLTEMVALNIALENGIFALPVWNQEVLFENLEREDLIPSYNIAPFLVSDAAIQGFQEAIRRIRQGASDKELSGPLVQEALEELGRAKGKSVQDEVSMLVGDRHAKAGTVPESEISHYEYTNKAGKKVRVEKGDASLVWENDGRGGKRPRYKAGAKHKHRYLRGVVAPPEDMQLSLSEGQPHMITLLAWQKPGVSDKGERRPGHVLALSQARVSGGSMSVVDPDGSGYGATLVPLRIFPEDGGKFLQHLGTLRSALELLPLPAEAGRLARQSLDWVASLREIKH